MSSSLTKMLKIIKLSTLKRSLPHGISSVPSSQFLLESQRRSVLRHLPEEQMKFGTPATSHVWPEDKKKQIYYLGEQSTEHDKKSCILQTLVLLFNTTIKCRETHCVYQKCYSVLKKLRPKTLRRDRPVSQKQYKETRALQNSDPLRITLSDTYVTTARNIQL